MGIIQAWLAAYPAEHRAHLEERLKSPRIGQRSGAGLEILIHAMLRAMEWEVRVSSETPDFIVTDQGGATIFTIEATSLEADREAETKMKVSTDVDKVLKEFDQNHRDHRVSCTINFVPDPPYYFPEKDFLDYLEERVKSYNGNGYKDFICNGWTISVEISRTVEHIGPSICMTFGYPASYPRIRKVLSRKSAAYDGGGKPYIIAISISDTFVEDDDFMGPLLDFERPGLSGNMIHNHISPVNEHVSGLWGFSRVHQVRGIESSLPIPLPLQCCYFPNPFAQFPMKNPFPNLNRYVLDLGQARKRITGTMSIAEILGLPEDWSKM